MCLVRDQKKRWGIEDLLCDKFLRGEDDERFVGISVDEIRSLIEQTLGFGRMSGGNGLSKETIETLAKVWIPWNPSYLKPFALEILRIILRGVCGIGFLEWWVIAFVEFWVCYGVMLIVGCV
jgi:hypothetical protein